MIPVELIEKIHSLRKRAAFLEPDAAGRAVVRDRIVSYTEKFLEEIHLAKAFHETRDKGAGLLKSPVSPDPLDVEEVLRLFSENVDHPGLNPASGGHLAYIPGGGIYYSSLGDYMAAISNRYAGVFYASPGAVRMTNMMIDWMAGIVGYPSTAGGNLLSGGSLANLTAIVTARDAHGLKGKDYEKAVVYFTGQAHHCLDKAIRIAGLKECVRRRIPMDGQYRMNVDALRDQVQQDRREGLYPWLVIASAGTTDVGAIDPLDEIGDLCQENRIWFHIDGAYGAFFVLTEEGRAKLGGIEKSDSLVMDPHKGLFLPYGLGVLLVRDRDKLRDSFHYHANYMQDAVEVDDEISPAEVSPELTTHFRALRMWLPLKLCGTDAFVAGLDEKLLLARYFHEQIGKIPRFEVGPTPELSVVTYRYVPETGDPNRFNEALLKAVVRDGRVFLSSTMLDGKFTLRLAVLAFRSHLETIDLALQVLKEKVAELSA